MSKVRFELNEEDARTLIHAVNMRGLDLWSRAILADPSIGQTASNLERIADELQRQSGLWGSAARGGEEE